MTTYPQKKNNLIANFSLETIKSSREWHNILQLLTISLRIEKENQTFSHEGKLRKFVNFC